MWLYDGDWSVSQYPGDCAEMMREVYWALAERLEAVDRTAPIVIDGTSKPTEEQFHLIPAALAPGVFFTEFVIPVLVGNFWYILPKITRYFDCERPQLGAAAPYTARFRTYSTWAPFTIGEKFMSHISTPIAAVNTNPQDHMRTLDYYFQTEVTSGGITQLLKKEYLITSTEPINMFKNMLADFTYMHTVNSSYGSSVTDLSGTFTYG